MLIKCAEMKGGKRERCMDAKMKIDEREKKATTEESGEEFISSERLFRHVTMALHTINVRRKRFFSLLASRWTGTKGGRAEFPS